jgi:hypothetical protein
LVFVPFLFRQRLKPRAALILAFFLAFDPGLLALSRQAGSSILAVTFLLFAWGFGERGSSRLAGMFAAGALLSGTALWPGLLGLGLSWAILQSMEWSPAQKEKGAEHDKLPMEKARIAAVPERWKPALQAFLITSVLFGTLIFLVPGGLNGALTAPGEYLRGWTALSGTSGRLVLLSLVLYQPLALILALVATVRGWIGSSRRVIRLSIWMLVALLLAVFYPAHRVHDLVWALIPLSALAALELSHHFDLRLQERLEVGGVILLTVLILIFAWLDLASLPWTPGPSGESNLRIWLLFGSLFLLIVSVLLVAVGWSVRTARLGAVWGATIFLTIYSLAAGLAAGRVRANYTSELWESGSDPAHIELLVSTVDQLSEWSEGNVDAVPVMIYNVDSPALRWALRSHTMTTVDGLDPTSSPPVLITPFQDNPGLAAPYRGQDFTWSQEPNWSAALPGDWLKWIALREMPQQYETIMLWARDDLFLDASLQASPP